MTRGTRARYGSRWRTLGAAGLLVGALLVPGTSASAAAGLVSNYTDPSISQPGGIVTGPDGAIWFTSSFNNAIERFVPATGAFSQFTDPTIVRPLEIIVGPDGALWFTNPAGNSIGRITTGGAISNYKDPGMEAPYGIAVGSDGALWFTNFGNYSFGSIGRMTIAGKISTFNGSGIYRPYRIAAGADGALWFTNYGPTGPIGRITTGGNVSTFTGFGVSYPEGITAGVDGALWFTNNGTDSIGKVTTGGAISNFTGAGISSPIGISVGPDGALWFANQDNDSIGRITTSGTVSNYTGAEISEPTEIAAGPGSGLWFSNLGNDSIGRITTISATWNPTAETRVLDTRVGTGLSGPFSSSVARTFQVTGIAGVPAGAIAVTGNLTVTNQSSAGFVSLTPSPTTTPTTSTINFPVNDNRANRVTVPLGAGGTLSATYVAAPGATTDLIFDLTGYFEPDPSGATYEALTPSRLLDTRTGTGLLGPFQSAVAGSFQVAGLGGVPADAVAVTGNLTVTRQTSAGFVSLRAVPTNAPNTSTLNFPRADNRANGVTAGINTNGTLSATYRATGGATTHLIFDVTGCFVSRTTGASYFSVIPSRLLDTRSGTGLPGAFNSGAALTFQVTGRGGVPAGAVAVTGNLTVTNQTSAGFVTLTPNATNNPTTSTLNFPVNDNRANGVTVPLGAGGTLSAIYRAGPGASTDLIFDVTGYFVP